jgi:seryl-tRNA synthetase
VKIAGSRFYVYNEQAAKLERLLIQFMLKTHASNGYKERMIPYLVTDQCMFGTGQFPKFQDEYYRLSNDNLNLIPTAEVPLTNLFADEILKAESLPVCLTAATPCFRREAGSAGKDTRGLIRVHQFQKVELVIFSTPEKSSELHEKLTADAEAILKKLNLVYRVQLLCSGDTSSASSKTYDLEVWFPGLNRWVEISSCSHFLDYQARRAKIRYKNEEGKNDYLHTLNGSGVAAGRLMAALMEYHQKDGDIDFEKIETLLL